MVQYKLSYFDGRGTAEIIRQIFALAGQEYEDVRYAHDEWPKHKDEMPFGQMPVLEVDGKQLAQSFAIVRFLSRRFGFAGETRFDEALVDSIADQFKDFMTDIRPMVVVALGFAQGDLAKLTKEVFLPARDKFFAYITKFLKANKSGYLVGDSLTYVDLYLAETSEFAKKVPTLYDAFPEIKAHAEKVRSIAALKKWIESRPKTNF
ncbi:glutathione S-transferase protein [Oesophagostomum dentatum]|uniref:glutathione transferase n=1 Tax=Oesophagostomum dentatum TaxID=61180 RepID=A0A0B1S574_OESDE|nr:glutathione S-transferase protein [Oesophagostomum dentatum]